MVVERLLGLSLSLQAIETAVAEAGQDVTTSYEQPAEPAAHRQLRQSWWCERMAKGSRWCSRLISAGIIPSKLTISHRKRSEPSMVSVYSLWRRC
jgi:hypothetical protein